MYKIKGTLCKKRPPVGFKPPLDLANSCCLTLKLELFKLNCKLDWPSSELLLSNYLSLFSFSSDS